MDTFHSFATTRESNDNIYCAWIMGALDSARGNRKIDFASALPSGDVSNIESVQPAINSTYLIRSSSISFHFPL